MKKIESLDLFRGIAGYGVAVCHFFSYLYESSTIEYSSFLFVDLFFVLSGFVLYPQLMKIYNEKKNIKIFYIRRWIRTLPIFIIALISFSIIFHKFDSDFLKYLIFVQKIFYDFLKYDYMVVAWSLSVEEWFYFIFPIFLVLFNRFSITKIFILFLIFIYILKLISLVNFNDANFYRTGTFLRLDAILVGALIAHYFDIIKKIKYIGLMLILSLSLYFYYKEFFLQNINTIQFFYIILIQLISIFSIIFFIKINRIINHKYVNKFYQLLANQTYSVYLFHFIFIYFIKIYNLQHASLIFFYYLITLFLTSTLVYYFFEKNLLDLRPNYKN